MKFNYVLCTLLIVSGAAQAMQLNDPMHGGKLVSLNAFAPAVETLMPVSVPAVAAEEQQEAEPVRIFEEDPTKRDSLSSMPLLPAESDVPTPAGTISLDLSHHLTRMNEEREKQSSQAQTLRPAVLSALSLVPPASPVLAPAAVLVPEAPSAQKDKDKSAFARTMPAPEVDRSDEGSSLRLEQHATHIRPKRNWKWFGVGAGVVAVAAAAIIYYLKWFKPASAAR